MRLILASSSAAFLLPALGGTAAAHPLVMVDPGAPWWTRWTFDPVLLVPLGLLGLAYAAGLTRLWRRTRIGGGVPAGRAWLFLAGYLCLLLALVSPIDAMADELASAHMAQHMVLTALAAPLLALAAPAPVLMHALPGEGGRRATRRLTAWVWTGRFGLRHPWRWMTRAPAAVLLQAAALWAWHMPWLYQLALENRWVHDLEHLTFFLTALPFWWVVAGADGGRTGPLVALVAVVATLVHTGLLAALMTLSPVPWYPWYREAPFRWGLSPLEDQQLSGLVMWVPAGLATVVFALAMIGPRLLSAGPARR